MLSIKSVSKTYAGATEPALTTIDLDIQEGTFVSLVGPSGCGKTTLLRLVSGLLQPTSGEIFLDGTPSTGPSPEKAVVFQHFNLLPWRSVLDNAAYGLEAQGMPKDKRREVAREYLKLVGLTRSQHLYPSQISGGMRQRVGIARALAISPRLLLMDEPFGALDALTRENLQAEMQRISADRALTVLFVTHSIDEAIFLSDRIIVMGTRPGRIIEECQVPFPRPRERSQIIAQPEFAVLRNRIWGLLEDQMRDEAAELEAQ